LTVHKSGFVNIIGNPNVGKSTLLNALVGEKMSIITSKPQTTRHRIFGILSDEDSQIVFSDSPGIIANPGYGMQKSMNRFAWSSFEDADILLFVTDIYEQYEGSEAILEALRKAEIPRYLIINKMDEDKNQVVPELKQKWLDLVPFDEVFVISARDKIGTDALLNKIREDLPEGPAYYPKDEISDKTERFFASEIIREKILMQYKQEVPYSCEVIVHRFKEEQKDNTPLLKIYADIIVDRKSQKPIIIGKNGDSIKKLGIAARAELEAFFEKHIFLDLNVKVKENWRDDERTLRHFGYDV
jgi:GTP-binding protein Era